MLTQVKCVITSPGNLKPFQSLSSFFESGAMHEEVRNHPQTQPIRYRDTSPLNAQPPILNVSNFFLKKN